MLIEIPMFKGEIPIASARGLPVECAQVATNTDLSQGTLKSFYRTHSAKTLNTTAWRSIFKIEGQGEIFWVCSEQEAFFALVPINIIQQRFYYTDGIQGKESNYVLASDGSASSYGVPNTYYKLGVPKPSSVLTVTVQGDGNEEIVDSVSYIYTYVTEWGYEGEPSDPTDVYDIEEGQYVELGSFGIPVPSGYNIVGIRIYRTSTGSTETDFLFISEIMGNECPDYITPDEIIANGNVWYDQISDLHNRITTEGSLDITAEDGEYLVTNLYSGLTAASDLDEAIASENHAEPPADLQGLIALSNSMGIGYKDKEIYPSEPYIHYGFPYDYRMLTSFNIKALGYYGTTVIVGTEGNPYRISGYDPQAVSVERLPDKQACLFTRAMVSGSNFVLYPSPDGLYMINDSGNRNITESIFTKEQWYDLLSDAAGYDKTLIAFLYDGKYYAFFEGTSDGFIIDFDSEVQFYSSFSIESDYVVYGGYVDLIDDTLYLLVKSGSTYYIRKWEGDRTKELVRDIISEAGDSITTEQYDSAISTSDNNIVTTGSYTTSQHREILLEDGDHLTTEAGELITTDGARITPANFVYEWKSKIFVTNTRGFFSCMKINGDFIANLEGIGTISASGTAVTGSETKFNTQLEAGCAIYDPTLKKYREVASVESDTALTLVSAFSSDPSAIDFQYNKMLMNIYKDDALFFTRALNSTNPFRIPSGLGKEWEIEIKGVYEVYPPVKMAQSMGELA